MAASLVTLDPGGAGGPHHASSFGRAIPIYRGTIDRMLIGEPDSVLIVEFHGHDAALLRKLAELDAMMGDPAIRPGGARHRRGAGGRAEDRCR